MRYLVLALLLLCTPAFAQNTAVTKTSSQHRAWAAFSYEESGAPTCYAAAQPSSRKGRKTGKDTTFAYVTQRPAERALDVFHYAPDFELALGSTVTVEVDKDRFTLFSAANGAFARGADTDRAIVNALRKGRLLIITATGADKTKVVDTFSLSGSGLALEAINKMCGL